MLNELITWMNANQGMSGWAQTIGSFIALGIAIWVPYHQSLIARRTEEKARQQVEIDQVEKLGAMCLFARTSLQKILDLSSRSSIQESLDAFEQDFSPQALHALVSSINDFPVFTLPNAAFVTIGLKAREACNLGAENAKRYHVGLENGNSMEIGHAASNVSMAIGELSEQIDLLINVRNQLIEDANK
jgi:hypothetical protein